MTAVFADTFFFLALLNRKDRAHQQVTKYDWRSCRLITTAWVLTEVGDAMCAPRMRQGFVDLVDFLTNSRDAVLLDAHKNLFDRGIELFRQRPDKEWSLTDCISFAAMQEQRLTEALTADKHFQQAGFRTLFT